jgi:hypothetical protein
MISIRLAALVMAATAVPAAAGPLVVRAIGPSAAAFKPGQRLADVPLVLRAGDVLTVLDAKGTRNFTGPGTFSLAAASQAATEPGFAALLVQKPERRARIGAVRGTGGDVKPVPPGIWAVDAGQSGTVCALDPAQVSLWRADPAQAVTLSIRRASDGASASVAMAAGQATATLPAAVAGKPGALAISGIAPVTITLKQVPAAPDIEALGASFVAAGCMGQFERLASATVQPQ